MAFLVSRYFFRRRSLSSALQVRYPSPISLPIILVMVGLLTPRMVASSIPASVLSADSTRDSRMENRPWDSL